MIGDKYDKILIAGYIITSDNQTSVVEFADKFREFLESNNWRYCGTTKPPEENPEMVLEVNKRG